MVVLFAALVLVATPWSGSSDATGQSRSTRKEKKASICGNPKLPCKTTVTFQPHDLSFRVPANAVIWDTEPFYAIVLKSAPAREDDCDVFIPEKERLEAQSMFPDRKVFSSRCVEPGELYYTNVDSKYRIMALYAGANMAEAKRALAAVKATGKFPDAYLRRMQTGFNGT